jgi:predicted TPR repeat methyltransferase
MSDGIPPRLDIVGEAEALIAAGQPATAATLLTKRIEQGRGGVLARECLVRALLLAGENGRALEAAKELAQLNPTIALAMTSLGDALRASANLPAAIAEYQRALRLDPEAGRARFGLGLAWLDAGEAEKALEAFAAVEENVTGLASATARAEALLTAQRSPPGYVRHLFDQFSASYDERMLGQLAYRAPATLRDLFSLVATFRHDLAILDLGCGTGLSGLAFRDLARTLDGVDLSPRMIEEARKRRIYDDLWVGDIEDKIAQRYDLIIAADTLVYLGDLQSAVARAAGALAAGGMILFTVERKDGEGFELGPKRRWRHSENYLRSVAGRCDLEISGLLECTPRHEAGEAVPGYAVALSHSVAIGREAG